MIAKTPTPTAKTAAEIKAEREKAARIASFTQADARPENTNLDAILGSPAGEGGSETALLPVAEDSSRAAAPLAPESAVAAQQPPPAEEAVSSPALPRPARAPRTNKAAAPPAAEGFPWDTDDVLPKGFTTKIPPDLHAKMIWIIDNVPRQSIQKIVHAAIREHVDRVIAEIYKP